MTMLFTADHEWLRIEGDVAIIGVTDYAQSQLGEIGRASCRERVFRVV